MLFRSSKKMIKTNNIVIDSKSGFSGAGRTLTSVGEDSGTGCTSGANGEAAKSTPNSAKVYSVCGTLLRNACDGRYTNYIRRHKGRKIVI